MKIYATNNLNIERYAGKDLWVKVTISPFSLMYYIRIISIVGGTAYYNMCNADTIELPPKSEDFDPYRVLVTSMPRNQYIEQTLTNICNTPKDKIYIHTPVDVLTTDEIVAGLTLNLDEED